LSSHSFTDFVEAVDYIRFVAKRDKEISDAFLASRNEVAAAREHTKIARDTMEKQAKIVAVRVHQVRVLRDQLVAAKGQLDEERARKKADLDSLDAQARADAEEIDALLQVSADLAAKIRAPPAHSTLTRAAAQCVL